MKYLLLLLLLIPACIHGQKAIGDYAYVKYTNAGGFRDYEVIIQFSADSLQNYTSMKNEKRILYPNIFSHSFEVIAYMAGLHYSPVTTSHIGNGVELLMLFKKDKP